MLNRRTFLGGVAAGVGAAKGEAPVRASPLRANFWGPMYYDEKERQEVMGVLETGRPFRWYGQGAQPPMKSPGSRKRSPLLFWKMASGAG